MNVRSSVISLGILMALSATVAFSHHAAAEFDTDVVLQYEGIIKEFVWANPHIRAILATRNDAGVPITLEIEGNSPNTLRTMGVSSSSLALDEQVTATVSPSKRFPDSSAIGIQFVKNDGSVVPFTTNRARLAALNIDQPAAATAEQPASTIFEMWVARGGPATLGRLTADWPLTEKGQEQLEAYTPLMSPHAQCIPTSAPWLMAYSAAAVFEELDDRILFKSDWLGAERTIYTDGRDRPAPEDTFQQGYSLGRWEDGTLVVETTNFAEGIYNGIANSSHKRLVERFTLSDDGKSIDYRFVMEDSEFLVGEVSGTIRFDYRPDLELENLDCDRETARRFFREFQ